MGTVYSDTLADALTVSRTGPSYRLGPHSGVAQRAVLRERLLPTFVKSLSLTQAVTVGHSQAQRYRWGRALVEIIRAHQTSSLGAMYRVTLAQVADLAGTIRLARLMLLTEHVTAHQAHSLGLALALLGSIKARDAAQPATRYHHALAQEFLLSSSFSRAVAAMLTQALHAHQTHAPVMRWCGDLSQNVVLNSALKNTLVLVLSQDFDLDDAQLVRAIYQGDVLLDGVNLGGLYVSPSGMVTTWAVNTRTNAVTEYTNFDFNSFAQLGTKYVATSPSGVYELGGDTDAGESVIADVVSGLLQINGTKLSGLKGVYIAMRGTGEVYLKIIVGGGRSYTYLATIQPGLVNTKIKVGKGIRARYISFQLTTTGQDFDLDTMEFVPMLSDRRV
jgi:hypothetical protein